MDTAERLVTSAQELLWERGYVGTSPKAIQERAGAGQGSMYHHFRGKPDLALTAMRRSARELRAQAGSSSGGRAPRWRGSAATWGASASRCGAAGWAGWRWTRR
jgi:AcrR family transcriptional regulator